MGERERNIPLGITGHNVSIILRWIFKKCYFRGVIRIKLAQDKDSCREIAKRLMKFRVHNIPRIP
jgi:DNA-binding CsgD family transcriptional regulator